MTGWLAGDVVRLDDGSVWGMVVNGDYWVLLGDRENAYLDDDATTYSSAIGRRSPTLIARGGQPVPTGWSCGIGYASGERVWACERTDAPHRVHVSADGYSWVDGELLAAGLPVPERSDNEAAERKLNARFLGLLRNGSGLLSTERLLLAGLLVDAVHAAGWSPPVGVGAATEPVETDDA